MKGIIKQLEGYAINKKRLEYLEKTVKLIDIATRNENVNDSDAKEILKVIGNYFKSLDLLDDYDHRKIIKPKEKEIIIDLVMNFLV